jgi:Tfp pilus assembly protein PilN
MSQQINLFNPQFQPQKKIFTVGGMAAAVGVLVLGLVAAGGYAQVRVLRMQAEVAHGEQRMQKAQKRLEEATAQFAPRTKDGRLEAELAEAQIERDALRRVADVIERGDLGNTEGYAEYFRALARQSVNGVWLTGVTIAGAGAEIGVRGRALDPALVPGYLTRLRNERVLRGKPVGSMQIGQAGSVKVRGVDGKETESPAPYVEFSLQSGAAAGAAAVDAGATGGAAFGVRP